MKKDKNTDSIDKRKMSKLERENAKLKAQNENLKADNKQLKLDLRKERKKDWCMALSLLNRCLNLRHVAARDGE